MAQTLTKILLHIVFSTKGRRNLITQAVEPDLHAYLGGICRDVESPSLIVGGVENHVHLLVSLSKRITVCDFLLRLKRDSSIWIKTQGSAFDDFSWQDGYGAFSIGESQVEQVRAYIKGQREKHKSLSFEDELIALAKRYGVEFDPRYLLA